MRRLVPGEVLGVELYNTFAESDYGQHLEQLSRFGDFKPEWTPTELWCDILGDDVNNLRHMKHTLKIAREFVEVIPLSPSQEHSLLVTAAVHDWAEALTGDVPHPEKTAATEAAEVDAFAVIAEDLLGFRAPTLIDIVKPTLDKNTDNGDMFRCIEYIGYCTTAALAGVQAEYLAYGVYPVSGTRKEREQLVGGLLSLNKAVTVHNYKTLTDYVTEHPQVAKVVQAVRAL